MSKANPTATDRWLAKPGNRERRAAWMKEYRSRPEVRARDREIQRAARERDPEHRRKLNRDNYNRQSTAQIIWYSVHHRCKRSGIPFDLRVEDIVVPETCPLLGVTLRRNTGNGGRVGPAPNSPSLDRIDSSKGYVRGNVWVISYRANAIKNDATADELEKIAAGLRALGAPCRT